MPYPKQPLIMELEKNYGFKIFDLQDEERGWILDTNKGSVYIQMSHSSEAELLFQYSVYAYMKNKNFNHLLDLALTQDGKPYMKLDKAFLQAYGKQGVHKVKFKNPVDLQKVVQVVSEFHQASQNFRPIPGSKARTEWGRWIWVFRSYCMVAQKFKELLSQKREKEKLEKKFLESFDEFYSIGIDAIERLKETSYLDLVRDSMNKNELCLQNFDEKNFIRDESHEYKILSLANVKHDIRAIDVADFILANKSQLERAKGILQVYDAITPLTEAELNIIKAYIQFPHEYFKVIERYYKNKKDLTSDYWNKKIRKAIRIEKDKKDFMHIVLQEVVKSSDRSSGNEQGGGN